LSARFAVAPTRWSNCSHSINFHASPQDSVYGQTHFSFWGHHLARMLAWLCRTRSLPLGLHLKQGMQNMSYLKQWILECIHVIPKEMLQCVMTTFPSWLQECFEQHGGHLQNIIFKQ
jgi:hypothetical protein